MANLFLKQAKQYADARPSYPSKLFDFIASKTPGRDLAWDAGTGSGQAAQSLAGIFSRVIATDTSQKQLDFAAKNPNVVYQRTPPTMSVADVEQIVAAEGTVDLVTVAQALHWFDLPTFYKNVRWVLKKPHGLVAAWCYTLPQVSRPVDATLRQLYSVDLGPYWEEARKRVDDEYRTMEFPFEGVDGGDETGPFEFEIEKEMDLEGYITYLRSWSAIQTAKEKGIDFLSEERVKKFEAAWNEDGHGNGKKLARFPIFLRLGRVGNN